jgi:murein DD-endopeptidase MepM/ murein hydrolase activator NlpD
MRQRTSQEFYEQTQVANRYSRYTRFLSILLLGSLVLLFSISIFYQSQDISQLTQPQTSQIRTLPLPQAPSTPSTFPLLNTFTTPEESSWKTWTVKSGDSLARILSEHQIPASTVSKILKLGKHGRLLTRIKPGQKIRLKIVNKQLQSLHYYPDDLHRLSIDLENGEFHSQYQETFTETRLSFAHGILEQSLFLSAKQAGVSSKLTMQLISIFGWDIDFAMDVRPGDRFSILYESHYQNGDKLTDGNILAATFTNRGRQLKAVRFTDNKGDSGFYAPDGRSMKKSFLRTPVKFSRISSRFSLGRKHPVLNKIRAHHGVDYAAPKGTVVKSTGNGKVIFRGRKGGYGKTLIIQHGQKYKTLYAHLSRYARKTRKGKRIQQGQIIAYVGQSGLATGPHLHYEFRVNNKHKNPLTVKFPTARPLAKKYVKAFRQQAQPLLQQLEAHERMHILLAANGYSFPTDQP